MTEEATISWTPEKLARFKTAIKNSKGLSMFHFDGYPFDRKYAEYLAEYLTGEFNRRKN